MSTIKPTLQAELALMNRASGSGRQRASSAASSAGESDARIVMVSSKVPSRRCISLRALLALASCNEVPAAPHKREVSVLPRLEREEEGAEKEEKGKEGENGESGLVGLPDNNVLGSKAPDCYWVNVSDATPAELNDIATAFGLHPLTVEDVRRNDIREKMQSFSKYLYVAIYCAAVNENARDVVHVLLMSHVVLTISAASLEATEQAMTRLCGEISHQRESGASGSALFGATRELLSPDWILYFILDRVADDYLPVVRALSDETDSIDELLTVYGVTEHSDLLTRIGIVRGRMHQVMSSLASKQEILRKLCSPPHKAHTHVEQPRELGNATLLHADAFSPEVLISAQPRQYLTDVYDNVVEAHSTLRFTESALDTSSQAYLARVSIEVAQASNRMAEQMNTLSVVATLMLPLSLVAGLFGMNCKVPGQDEDNFYTFYAIVGAMCAFLVVCGVRLRSGKSVFGF